MLRAGLAGFNGALLLVLDVFLWHWQDHPSVCVKWIYNWQESYPYCDQMSFRYVAPWPWLVGIGVVALMLLAYAWFCYRRDITAHSPTPG